MRKFLIRIIAVAIGFELVYLILVNIFLNTSLGPDLVNMKPEKFQLRWESGWSVIPGLVNAKGVNLRAQTKRTQWYLEAEEGNLWIRWWKLPFKHFEASGIEAAGLSFFLRRRLPDGATPQKPSTTPEIPGLANPPGVSPERLYPLTGGPWHIVLEDLDARNLNEIWVQQVRIKGQGKVSIGHYSVITRGGPSTLSDSTVEFTDAALEIEEQVFASDLQIQVQPILDPVTIRGSSLEQIAQHVSGTASIGGRIKNLDALNMLHSGLPIHINSESQADLTANVKLEYGRLAPESTLLVSARDLVASYLHYTVKGHGTLRGEVTEQDEQATTTLRLVFDEFSLADDQNEPYLKGRGFELVTTAKNVGLADSGQNLKVVATLPESFVPDLKHYNDYIPAAVGLKMEQGTGRLLSQFEFSKDEQKIAGEIKLALTDVIARYQSVTVSGHVDLHTVVEQADLKSKRYDAAGTRLDFSDITISRDNQEIASEWWSKITFGNTALNFKPDPAVAGEIEIRMSDTKPVIAVFKEREELPDWIKEELILEDLNAQAVLDLSNSVVTIRDFELQSGNWTMLGDMVVKQGDREGILYIENGPLSLAIERTEDQKKVKLLAGREWFDERRAAFRANTQQQ